MSVPESVHQLIHQLEKRLQQPEVRSSPAELDGLLSEDFIEFGSSGRVFDKKAIIEAVGAQASVEITMTDFRTALLAPDIILATYRASIIWREGNSPTHSLRSSIWRLSGEQWRMVFHQGTPILTSR